MSKVLHSKSPWLAVSILSGFVFAKMLIFARYSPDILEDVDSIVSPHIIWLQSFGTTEIFLAITTLGSVLGVAILALGAAFFLRTSRASIVRLVVLLAGAGLSVDAAKLFVARARPEVLTWLTPESSFSFPSGHSTLSMAFYGFIAVSLYRRANSTLAKTLSVLIPGLLIFMIGFSRMVLNYHYFTDVIAGFLLGLFWLSVVFMLPRSVINFGK
ncbi:MAG: phosphatase PAP2 family protein [Candidatus Paceibacterota bacterium]